MTKVLYNLADLRELNIELENILKKLNGCDCLMVYYDLGKNKRSNKQLRAYWKLIKVIQIFFTQKGHPEWDEEIIHNYFKIKSGLYIEVNGNKIARSISNNSKITKEEMSNLLDTILKFGIDNKIKDCVINQEEYEEIINYYNK